MKPGKAIGDKAADQHSILREEIRKRKKDKDDSNSKGKIRNTMGKGEMPA